MNSPEQTVSFAKVYTGNKDDQETETHLLGCDYGLRQVTLLLARPVRQDRNMRMHTLRGQGGV